MNLSDLLIYDKITIQCHDNPDADALAAGFGLYTYFKQYQKDVSLIYSGRYAITKTNLLLMISELHIPITYTTLSKVSGLLITVDCQYSSGNVTLIKADSIVIIDHHPIQINNLKNITAYEISTSLGSCSTLVWQMLLNDGFKLEHYPQLSTALYFGLMSDTNGLTELIHPLDLDMHDQIYRDEIIIKKLRNSNLSLDEIEIAGLALIRYSYNESTHSAIVKAHPCDPNVLGLISDIILQVDVINVCIVFNETSEGIKFSVRSCEKEVHANELAQYLSQNIGSGGGHFEKAGGFINKALFQQYYPDINMDGFFHSKLSDYFKSYQVFYAGKDHLDFEGMTLYKKEPLILGYVKPAEIFPIGTPLLIRTLECDIEITSQEDIYIMVGILGEVYPIELKSFNELYAPTYDTFVPQATYEPSIRNLSTRKSIKLYNYINACVCKNSSFIYAKSLKLPTKVFTRWEPLNYMYGKTGDFIACKKDNPDDVYIIQKDIFFKTYQPVNKIG